jgi:type I restriction enzyme S subunit
MTEDGNGLPELPQGWAWTTIGEIAQVITGTTPSKKDPSNYGDYIPFVKPPQLNDCVITEAKDNLSEKGASLARILPPDSVLVSCIGILGKTGINKLPVAFNQQINAIVFPEMINPRYGFYYFQSAETREWLKKKASATTVTIINKSKFMTAPIPIPPLAEQQRIVAKVEELFTQLDAGVAALEKAKAQLRRYRQAVLKAAVEGELTRERREAHWGELEPASVLLERILEERQAKWEAEHPGKRYEPPTPPETDELPELPEGWVWATFGQVICLSQNGTGTRRSQEEGEPTIVLRLADIVNGETISLEDVRRIKLKDDEVEKYRLLENDLLCIRVNGSPNLVGRMIPFKASSEPIVFCDHFIRFRLAIPEITPFLSMCFDMDRVRRYVDINKVSSAGQNTVSQGTMAAIAVPLPSLTEQQHIMHEVEQRLSVIDEMEKAVEQSLKRAERLRQSILKRAFEGKLMPQDPSDEPASVLLERIKAEKAQREGKGKGGKRSRRQKRPRQLELFTS